MRVKIAVPEIVDSAAGAAHDEGFSEDLMGPSVDASIFSKNGTYREWKTLKYIIEHLTRKCRIESLKFENFDGMSIPVFNVLGPIFNKLRKVSFVRCYIPMTIPFFLKKWSKP